MGPQDSLGGGKDDYRDEDGRPRGPTYDLPLAKVKLKLGDRVDPQRLFSGWYDFEIGWYRRLLLRELVKRYRMWAYKNPENWHHPLSERRALVDGHKDVIRKTMAFVDTAYSAEVIGVRLRTSQNEGHLANQCYVGAGGAGYSGSDVYYSFLWRGQTSDGNHQAIVFRQEWQQGTAILAAYAHANPELAYSVADTRSGRDPRRPIPVPYQAPSLGKFVGVSIKEMSRISSGDWMEG